MVDKSDEYVHIEDAAAEVAIVPHRTRNSGTPYVRRPFRWPRFPVSMTAAQECSEKEMG
jgi:hypothetical protein